MRLFFAIWPPTEVANQLTEITRSTAFQLGGQQTRQESLHLTLAFLGEVLDEQLPLLIQTARSIQAAPFMLNIDFLGYWQHNLLLWAGQHSQSEALVDFVEDLQIALIEAGFVVEGRSRGYNPHITLIRKLPAHHALLTRPLTLLPIDSMSWSCSSFSLVRSQISDTGSVYQTVADFPLRRN